MKLTSLNIVVFVVCILVCGFNFLSEYAKAFTTSGPNSDLASTVYSAIALSLAGAVLFTFISRASTGTARYKWALAPLGIVLLGQGLIYKASLDIESGQRQQQLAMKARVQARLAGFSRDYLLRAERKTDNMAESFVTIDADNQLVVVITRQHYGNAEVYRLGVIDGDTLHSFWSKKEADNALFTLDLYVDSDGVSLRDKFKVSFDKQLDFAQYDLSKYKAE